ncbi:MAG TPA: hypothetical protein VFV95_15620 [Vicinamibacterales bacterium]|nr:hypothetical protein [Vicinamibacterales bacterium]
MTTVQYVSTQVLPVVYALLPPQMRSANASAMLLAIGLQESRFTARRQVGGPARGFWQFEQGGGVAGVLSHPSTKTHAATLLTTMRYSPDASGLHAAIEHNDVLAGCFARLLLWTLPGSMPAREAANIGWNLYVSAWRPGKPHRETWDALYVQAWAAASGKEPF